MYVEKRIDRGAVAELEISVVYCANGHEKVIKRFVETIDRYQAGTDATSAEWL